MTRTKRTILAVAAALLTPMWASADPITYDIDISIGAGTVNGTITTNGTQGAVLSDDILAYEISVNDGIDTFSLNMDIGLAQMLGDTSSLLLATSTSLSFDFDGGADGWFALENIYAPGESYRFVGWFQENNWMTIRHEAVPGGHADLQIEVWEQEGLFEIGTVASVSEPATLALFAIGLFGAGLARRRIPG